MSAVSADFRAHVEALRAEHRARLARANAALGDNGGRVETRWGFVLVHRSTRTDGHAWQATDFDSAGTALGHTTYRMLRPPAGEDDTGCYPMSAVGYVASVLR